MASQMKSFMNPMKMSLINLPSPSGISLMWNFGSLLGMILTLQILTGLFLSMHYSPSINLAFESIIHISRDVNYGWLLRALHANGASLFFALLFAHIGRGMYYKSFTLKTTWTIGTLIFLASMATAFLGYVLPWGQMSFWGATVITNLLSAIPYINSMVMAWVWGGFSIDNPTLNRLYSLHFILPFIIAAMVLLHLTFLHQTGSTNPLGLNSNLDKISFHPYFSLKDSLTIIMALTLLITTSLLAPYVMGDPENFSPANPLITPVHIQPEWYFLFAYAILRSVPNKLGGVCALMASVLMIVVMPFINSTGIKPQALSNKIMFWLFAVTFITLTWLGAKPVEYPFIQLSSVTALTYFILLILL